MKTAAMTQTNGVDMDAVQHNLDAMKADPRVAAFEFRGSTRWKSGAMTVSTFAGYKQNGLYVARPIPHELTADEPTELLGQGTSVGPTGHLMHALTHSLAVTMIYYAAKRELTIRSLKIDAEGTLDLQGLLGLDEKVRPGFQHIHLTVRVESPNSRDEIASLFRYAQTRCPMCATVSQPVPVEWTFEVEPSGAGPDESENRHGVSYPDLAATVTAFQQQPALAKCRFYISAEWLGGMRVQSVNPGFDQAEGASLMRHRDPHPKGYMGDEPSALLGGDTGPSSAEAMLQAMASCVSITSSYHAAARGMAFEAFAVDLEGDLDRQGFAALDDRVTPGYQRIRGRVYIKAGATPEELNEFMRFATTHSPMCNSVHQPVPLTFSLVVNGEAV